MSGYRHHVSGFFVHRAQAEDALSALVLRGLPRERLQIMDADKTPPEPGWRRKQGRRHFGADR